MTMPSLDLSEAYASIPIQVHAGIIASFTGYLIYEKHGVRKISKKVKNIKNSQSMFLEAMEEIKGATDPKKIKGYPFRFSTFEYFGGDEIKEGFVTIHSPVALPYVKKDLEESCKKSFSRYISREKESISTEQGYFLYDYTDKSIKHIMISSDGFVLINNTEIISKGKKIFLRSHFTSGYNVPPNLEIEKELLYDEKEKQLQISLKVGKLLTEIVLVHYSKEN